MDRDSDSNTDQTLSAFLIDTNILELNNVYFVLANKTVFCPFCSFTSVTCFFTIFPTYALHRATFETLIITYNTTIHTRLTQPNFQATNLRYPKIQKLRKREKSFLNLSSSSSSNSICFLGVC